MEQETIAVSPTACTFDGDVVHLQSRGTCVAAGEVYAGPGDGRGGRA
jgi:hypothetical protein